MTNGGRIIITILITVLFLFQVDRACLADEKHDGDRDSKIVAVPADRVIDEDYFGTGEIIEVSGIVNGDVYVTGGRILVDGTINGDLLAAGGTIRISGHISQNARIIGGQITIDGEIGRNLTAVAGDVELAGSSSVRGGTVIAGGNVTLAGPIGRYARIAAGSLIVSSSVNGDLEAAVGEMNLTSNADVNGNLTYLSNRSATFDERATIAGNLYHITPAKKYRLSSGGMVGLYEFLLFLLKVLSLASTLFIGLLLIYLFPRFSDSAVENLKTMPWIALGAGTLFFLAGPVVFGMLLITLIGIPLAVIVMALYLISLYLAKIFVIYWAGSAILERPGKRVRKVWVFIAGLVLYSLLSFIPVLGGISAFLIMLIGLGALALTERQLYRAWKEKALI
jgi:hypothetical protein